MGSSRPRRDLALPVLRLRWRTRACPGVRRRAVAVAFVIAASIFALASGCTSSSQTTTVATARRSSEPVTVRVGIAVPLTAGPVAIGQGVERGATLAVEDAADHLAELGVTLEPLVVDDRADPRTGVAAAEQLVSDPTVVAVVGHVNSGVAIPAADVYAGADMAMVSPAAMSTQLTQLGHRNVFRTCTTDAVLARSVAHNIREHLGIDSACVVHDSTAYGEGLADEFASAFEELGGTIPLTEATTDKDTEFHALATRIAEAGPQAVFYGGVYTAGALFSKQLSEAGFDGPVVGGGGMKTPDFIGLAGEACEGDMATASGAPLMSLPGGVGFHSRYIDRFGEEVGAYDPYAYDAASAIVSAIEKVAAEEGADYLVTAEGRSAVVDAIAASDLSGVTGHIGFDDNGDTLNHATTLYRIEAGEWRVALSD